MRIERFEVLRCDAGWRTFSFLKMASADGVIGWSEFNESFGSPGLGRVIEELASAVVGMDPRASELVVARLHVLTRQSRGGLIQQAIAAIENAVLDIRAKAAGVPVCALFGGPIRTRIPLYWSHFGTYRVGGRRGVELPRIRTLDELARHAAEVRSLGFRALKTNILRIGPDGALGHFAPGFGRSPGWPELNWDNALLAELRAQLAAIREAAGPEMGIHLDLNFHFRTEGFLRMADAVAPFGLTWLEIDTHDPGALADIRRRAPCPIASCETLHGRRDFRPYFEARAVDVPIVDVIWNGLGESVKIAAMADAYELNCAPHNFYGHLSSAISAHFCAAIPNFRVMEIDVDSVAWRDELVLAPPVIENGELVLPAAPGWGVEPDEAAIRARPPAG
ncbi:mandelate racemase/muconate lactonizing enzyme family protein [Caldovatus aquaticus]|uniref:Mandelate racemase/muconate lactonizing enzyme family protein n=1 Tax=Caldovatus aquaticus TaxID=2865671 RepID=A0ABS7EYV9_9PROT|nr:mandelate racemase/muconate lactonizing enzyme family protein [Caldovatus aquaticus]MBW8268565.1 mandelate racemase/muconate lactonizing enzyme family protein [Caldovatus aquaticus]